MSDKWRYVTRHDKTVVENLLNAALYHWAQARNLTIHNAALHMDAPGVYLALYIDQRLTHALEKDRTYEQ